MTAPVGATQRARGRPRPDPRPVPAPDRRPPLRVVDPVPRHRVRPSVRRHPRLLPAAAAVAVAAALFGLVAAHALLAQGQFRLQDLERRADVEQARYERLRLDVARLEAPARVVSVAQERLGMVPPAAVTYLSPSGPASTPSAAPPSTAVAEADGDGDGDGAVEAAMARWSGVKRELGRR